jgi:hypothetical protein
LLAGRFWPVRGPLKKLVGGTISSAENQHPKSIRHPPTEDKNKNKNKTLFPKTKATHAAQG